MRVENVSYSVLVPAGEYWLGDPCYAVPDELWDSLLESSDFFNLPVGLAGKHKVLAFGTAYGDGMYRDQLGNMYPVDAGLIGLVPVELAKANPFGMKRVKFIREERCTGDDGVMQFGEYKINTRDDDVMDDYDDEEE